MVTPAVWGAVTAMAEALLRRNVLTWRQVQRIMGSMTIEKSLADYVMVFERSLKGYCAYVPDLPGCIATGRTLAQTQKLMREAITLHLKGMRKDWRRIPRPTSLAELRRKGLVR
jgi:predicted RNase H-like HicB family nuclease